ncbi:MAG: uracil phosphoribosyltransferase [Actinobacteria bacterium]|nr:MAG: uracil phosphoribosyltransferase [Actinomycetota bacterium]
MGLTVVDHPLARHLLTRLRDVTTPPPVFRTLAKRLTVLIVLEAVRELPTVEVEVETPLERTSGRLISPDLVAVPILRAGLGMLESVTELFPEVSVGYVGLERDDVTLLPTSYYEKLPPLQGRHVLLLDPMLATGGSAAGACAKLREREPAEIRFACVVAAPQGVEKMAREHPDVEVFAAALDRDLNGKGYILPGLGDFGDRLFGTGPDSGLPPPLASLGDRGSA